MLSESKAHQQGLSFTGIYSRSIEEVRQRVAEYKALKVPGKLSLVRSPASKYSRSYSAGGYSAYADQRYFDYRSKLEVERRLSDYEATRARLRTEYDAAVTKVNVDQIKDEARLKELIAKGV